MALDVSGSKANAISVRNAELITKHLADYLSIRFDHAVRISPHLRTIKEDFMYHEMANVRRCLLGEKIYGPIRKIVSDVLVSDNESERNQIFSPSHQCSIQVELVSHVAADKVETTRGQLRVHDIKMYYGCINAQMMDFIDLFETWLWWDLPDAVEMVRFEQKLGVIQAVETKQVHDKLRRHLSMLIHPPASAETGDAAAAAAAAANLNIASDREIIDYEIAQILKIQERWTYRSKYEEGYKFVLKRDDAPHATQGDFIHKITEKVRQYDLLEHSGLLDEDTRNRFAPLLRTAPEKITKEQILAHLQEGLVELEKGMLAADSGEVKLGPPYNYKAAQLQQIDRWTAEIVKKYGETPEQIEAKKISLPPKKEAPAPEEPQASKRIPPQAANTPITQPAVQT